MTRPISATLDTMRLGNYQPLLELASGGMATVYVARQVGGAGFERLVVIKRVHPHLRKDRAFTDMFLDEARMCSTIRHPNVVPVIDVVAQALVAAETIEVPGANRSGLRRPSAVGPTPPPPLLP